MKFLVFFASALSTISDCGTNPLFKIVSQSFTSDIPKAGDIVSWTIEYSVPDGLIVNSITSVNSGLINGFLPIDTTTSDLCQEISCPVTSGTYSLTNTVIWPDGVSGSKVVLTSEWEDENGNELLCSKVSVTGAKNLRGNNKIEL